MGARVVKVPVRGYGAALAAGTEAAAGKYVIMGDSDESYDFSALAPFVAKLREGYDLVMGNRYRGGISPGAMPPMHRYFGNPLLTALGRLFFSCRSCGDFYCGLRGFRKDAIEELALQSRGMEFALEMVIKSRCMAFASPKYRQPSHPMAATGRRTCGAIATDGEVCASTF